MKRKTIRKPDGVRPVVLAVGGAVGFAWTAEGSSAERLVGRRGRAFGVDWPSASSVDSSVLFHGEDGSVEFVRNREGPASELLRLTSEDGLVRRAYSPADPLLVTHRVSAAMCAADGIDAAKAVDKVAPLVREFLGGMDFGLLGLSETRPLTAAEYTFLAAGPERRQAAALHEWLLPWILHGLSKPDPGPAERVLAAIDGRKELLPALCAEFSVAPNVVRSMSVLPLWRPDFFRVGPPGPYDVAPEISAKAFSLMAPEQRPDKRSAKRFLEVAVWTVRLLSESGDCGSLAAYGYAVAETWKRLRRRPYELPDFRSISWISELREVVRVEKGGRKEPPWVSGTIGNERVKLPWGAWAALWAVSRHHPADQGAEERKWLRRRMASSRALVREIFPPSYPLPAEYPDFHDGPGGWRAVRISTAGELADHSETAENCLACCLTQVLRRKRFPYAGYAPDGELAGHFEIHGAEDGSAELGQVLATKNRVPPPGLKRLAESALAAFVRETGTLFPPETRDGKFHRAAKECRIQMGLANKAAHAEEALSILRKAAERFRIGFPEGPEETGEAR